MHRNWNILWRGLLVIGIGMGMHSPAQAQRVETDATATKLSTVMHLSASIVTLDVLASEIEKQSGVAIRPEPYLLPHKMILKANGLSAVTLLNTLSEIYGWQWHETTDGAIVINRPTARVPASLPEVAKDIRKSLSPQLLRYLGCTEDASVPAPTEREVALRFPIVENRSNARAAHIWPSLPDPLRRQNALPVAQLSDTEREKVLESLVGQTFRTSYTCLNNLTSQNVLRFISDPLSVTVSYQYRKDGSPSTLLLAARWSDLTGTKRYMTGIGCSFQSLHNDSSADAIRKEAESIGQ